MADSQLLFHTPEGLDCAKWSEDNLLAVAAERAVLILSPANLQGPRAHVSVASAEPSALSPGCSPADWRTSGEYSLCAALEVAQGDAATHLCAKGVAWSPLGCTPEGGCLLAVLSSDGKVRGQGAACAVRGAGTVGPEMKGAAGGLS